MHGEVAPYTMADFVEQTFDVQLFDNDNDPLNKVTDMLRMINKMDDDGKKCEKKNLNWKTLQTVLKENLYYQNF